MIDIVLLTTGKRTELLNQSLRSLIDNRSIACEVSLTVVVDGNGIHTDTPMPVNYTCIFCAGRPGASACRNIGASSIPRYRRQKYVCFLDDDVYMCPQWDDSLIRLITRLPKCIVSGHGHPYNHAEERIKGLSSRETYLPPIAFKAPLVISTVHMLMSWELWDDVGFFIEPGGAGGGEDVDFCRRAGKKGYGFAITEPQCVIHTGLTSSNGRQIVGYDLMVKQNEQLIRQYGLEGKVMWK